MNEWGREEIGEGKSGIIVLGDLDEAAATDSTKVINDTCAHPSGQENRYFISSIKERPCAFNIPAFPSAYLRAQRPLWFPHTSTGNLSECRMRT